MKSCLFIVIILLVLVCFLGTGGLIYVTSINTKAETPGTEKSAQ
ncbi:hypothetical protein Rhal01_03381 [Rubritalea halochordaticola]|uniref:Uncharacterized protein n=1 Tax=Rubritalea halochordaticola TaxID=714537 RepID=A0ABP9V3F8_9BACT